MQYKTSKDYDGLVKILDEYSLTLEAGENTKVVYGKFTDKDGIVEHCLLFCVNCQYFMNCSGKMAIIANSAEEYVIALKQHNVEFIDPEPPKCELSEIERIRDELYKEPTINDPLFVWELAQQLDKELKRLKESEVR